MFLSLQPVQGKDEDPTSIRTGSSYDRILTRWRVGGAGQKAGERRQSDDRLLSKELRDAESADLGAARPYCGA
jgi:hypothetical protein